MRSNKGITLIALVITIIVLIILAGVAINLTLGENGIFRRAETAKLKYEISKAEEELDIKIAELQVNKQGSATLQDVVDMLKAEEDMDYIVSLEEIASITGVETIGDVDEIYVVYKIYQFRVDDRLQTEFISIVESYTADVAISSTLKSHDGKNEDEKYLATMEIKVESEGQVQSIEIETVDGKITETPTSLPYTKEIQVEIGQKYIVKVTTPDGKYKRYVVEEKAEDTIKTAEELAAFRDKVNSGLTYEGKTVTLVNDIDLSSVCGANVNGQEISWEPIGTETTPFAGNFNGNNNMIKKIYINASINNQGLFGYTLGGKIENIQMNLGEVNGYRFVGSVVGFANGTNIVRCINQDTLVLGKLSTGGVVGYIGEAEVLQCVNKSEITGAHSVGGIVGENYISDIKQSYNIGTVKTNDTGSINSNYIAGGIVGYLVFGTSNKQFFIENCYNIGDVYGKSHSTGIATLFEGNSTGGVAIVKNCYSVGNITGNGKYAISGNTYSAINQNINNYWLSGCGASSGSYTTGNTNATPVDATTLQGYASTLGDAYIADGKIKNESGEWEDNVDSQGNIIYINGGFPILKWQIGE